MWRFYLYKLLSDFLVIVPVMVPLYQANGLTATQIFLVQGVFSICQFALEVPSGYVADVMGRKRALILGAGLFVLGLTIYAFAQGFWQFALAEFVLGIGASMRSGTESALLFDTLKHRGRTEDYQRFEGHAESLTRLGTAISAMLGGLLAAVTLRLPFYVNLASAALLLLMSVTLYEPPREKRPEGNPFANILSIVRRSVTHPRLLPLMLFQALMLATGITAIWGYFLFFGKIDLPLASYGFAFAGLQLCSAFGAQQGFRLEKALGRARPLQLVAASGLMLLPFAFASTAWLLPFVGIHAFLWGVSTPLFLERINAHTTSDIRATTLSTGAMMGRVIYIALSLGFGAMADRASLQVGFGVLAVLSCLAAAALVTVIVRQERAAQAA